MRSILNFNSSWNFYKATADINVKENAELVNLPHSWNAVDGQDGGNDYYRGSCVYTKSFAKNELPSVELHYLEIQGANSSADVYLNGKKLAHHDGGYSTWRVNLTETLEDENTLAIVVGGLGIINTMLMSVFERTREIGVLKAVGWSNKKILTMIVGESLVITIVSAIIGSIIGFAACTLLGPQMGISPLFTPKIFIQAFGIAIIVGIIGGLYPAIKAVKLPPTEALRYE